MTYMLLLNCALKLVEEIILYYDARSRKHQIISIVCEVSFLGLQITDVNITCFNMYKLSVLLHSHNKQLLFPHAY